MVIKWYRDPGLHFIDIAFTAWRRPVNQRLKWFAEVHGSILDILHHVFLFWQFRRGPTPYLSPKCRPRGHVVLVFNMQN